MTDAPSSLERVLALVPWHARLRDADSGGLLAALARAVATELDVLERDVEQLYDSWFVETCDPWVLPYLAALLGVEELPPEPPQTIGSAPAGGSPAGSGHRAFVAHTVGYRRRKGTPAAIEQVARDATGWAARVVEPHHSLAVAANVAQVPGRAATASLRPASRLDLAHRAVEQGALDPLPRTPDIRRLGTGLTTAGLGRLVVCLFPDQVWPLEPAAPRPPSQDGEPWTVHPLGLDSPLFLPSGRDPQDPEAGLPVPLRPRKLLDLLRSARAGTAPDALPRLTIRPPGGTEDFELPAKGILVQGIETPSIGWQVTIDPVRGRLLAYQDGRPAAPERIWITCAVGATAEVGAGTYDRRDVHARALHDDPYHGGQDTRYQIAVGPGGRCTVTLSRTLEDVQTRWSLDPEVRGGTTVVVLPLNDRYDGDVAVHVPAGARLVLVAADWRDGIAGHYDAVGRRAHIAGGLTITGDRGSSVLLDGLVIEGGVKVGEGVLGSLTLSQCTVAGAVVLTGGGNAGVAVRLVRTAIVPPRPAPTAVGPPPSAVDLGGVPGTLRLLDSSVDAVTHGAIDAPGTDVTADGSTVRGALSCRTLDASSCLLDGTITVRHRQAAGLRYCYAPPDPGRPLRRFHCVPASGLGSSGPVPLYVSLASGSPHYLALAPGCPVEIVRGGEGGSEMGVHHHLGRVLRREAAERLLADYVPVGHEFGVLAPLPR